MHARFTFLRLEGFFLPPAPAAPGDESASSPPPALLLGSRLRTGPFDDGESEDCAGLDGEDAALDVEEEALVDE